MIKSLDENLMVEAVIINSVYRLFYQNSQHVCYNDVFNTGPHNK